MSFTLLQTHLKTALKTPLVAIQDLFHTMPVSFYYTSSVRLHLSITRLLTYI